MTSALHRTLAVAGLACALALGAARAAADDIYVRGEKATADLPFKNVTIRTVKDGELHYSINGRDTHRPITDISHIDLTGETVINAAETAYAAARGLKDEAAAKAKYGEALSGYLQTQASTSRPWLKDFVQARIALVAPRAGRLDLTLDAWKLLVEKDPVAGAKAKPSVVDIDPKSQYLINAAKTLDVWAKGANRPETKRVYLDMLHDVYSQLGDTENANRILAERVLAGGTPEEVADVYRQLANSALAAGKLDVAMQQVGKINQNLLSDAGRADVAFVIAEFKSTKTPPTSPPDTLKELAVEYMKVVAGAPTSAHAGAALVKVAEIHESLKEPETALKIYQQVVREQGNSPAGQAAQKAVDRLGKTARG
jgi:tetratricopeptide (TPR) repeat protein